MTTELDYLRDWHRRVADALGVSEVTEGHGWGCTADPEQAAEIARHYTETALTHERDCPVYCYDCEQYEMPDSCPECGGSGCGPGTALGAYQPCSYCGGDGRDHCFGYINPADQPRRIPIRTLTPRAAYL